MGGQAANSCPVRPWRPVSGRLAVETEPVAAVAECVAVAMAVAEGSACSYVEYWPVAEWRPMWRPMED